MKCQMHRKKVRLKNECSQYEINSNLMQFLKSHADLKHIGNALDFLLVELFDVTRSADLTTLAVWLRESKTRRLFLTKRRYRKMMFPLAALWYLFLLTTSFLSVDGLLLVSSLSVNTQKYFITWQKLCVKKNSDDLLVEHNFIRIAYLHTA